MGSRCCGAVARRQAVQAPQHSLPPPHLVEHGVPEVARAVLEERDDGRQEHARRVGVRPHAVLAEAERARDAAAAGAAVRKRGGRGGGERRVRGGAVGVGQQRGEAQRRRRLARLPELLSLFCGGGNRQAGDIDVDVQETGDSPYD